MPVPKMDDLYHPFMLCMEKEKETKLNTLMEYMVSYFGLSEEEKNEKIPSGKETKLKNRVGWARKYLRDAGLVSAPERGIVKITKKGQTAMASNHGIIDKKFIKSISEEMVDTSHHETYTTEKTINGHKHPQKQNLTSIYEANHVSLRYDPRRKRIYFQFAESVDGSPTENTLTVGLPCNEAKVNQALILSETLYALIK